MSKESAANARAMGEMVLLQYVSGFYTGGFFFQRGELDSMYFSTCIVCFAFLRFCC